eukprot:g1641.t1
MTDLDKKVDVGDQNAIKNLLDDTAREIMVEEGWSEDFFYNNVKLILMTVAVTVALASHFQPYVEFPESSPILITCASIYFLCSGIVTAIIYFKEQYLFENYDTIARTHPHEETGKTVEVRSEFTRFDEYYTLELLQSDGIVVKFKKSVGRYFTEAGDFCRRNFAKDVKDLFRDLGTGKKTK